LAENPYAPPQARVADAVQVESDGNFLPQGQRVPTGNGWRWITDSWAFMGVQRGTFIGIFVIYLLLVIGVSIVPGGGLAATLFGPVLIGGIVIGCDALRRGEALEVAHLFAGFKSQVGPLVGIGALTLGAGVVMAIVAIAILGGAYFGFMNGAEADVGAMTNFVLLGVLAVLIIVALSVPLYMAVFFAPVLIVLHGFKFGDALKTSFHVCWRNMLPFLIWGLGALMLAIPATLLLGLGWLLLGPVMMISMYVSYRDIFFTR
jgi:hypothetical protein